MSLSILYLGSSSIGSTSLYRANALKRLGCNVLVVDPYALVHDKSKTINKIHHILGFGLIQRRLLRIFKNIFSNESLVEFDCVWIDSGELIGPSIMSFLRGITKSPIVLFNHDDPTGCRDGPRFRQLLRSLPFYSLAVLVRSESELECKSLGVKNVLRVHRSYDEVVHQQSEENFHSYAFDGSVIFAGTLIPGEGRDTFIRGLLASGLCLKIYGSKWRQSRYWVSIRGSYSDVQLKGDLYSRALSSSGVCLGLLSSRNRDLVTTRSFEAPAAGALFCGERTSEHQLFFEDGVEAMFWDSLGECIDKCRFIVSDSCLNASIRSNGHKRMLECGAGNEDICRQVLATLGLNP